MHESTKGFFCDWVDAALRCRIPDCVSDVSEDKMAGRSGFVQTRLAKWVSGCSSLMQTRLRHHSFVLGRKGPNADKAAEKDKPMTP